MYNCPSCILHLVMCMCTHRTCNTMSMAQYYTLFRNLISGTIGSVRSEKIFPKSYDFAQKVCLPFLSDF